LPLGGGVRFRDAEGLFDYLDYHRMVSRTCDAFTICTATQTIILSCRLGDGLLPDWIEGRLVVRDALGFRVPAEYLLASLKTRRSRRLRSKRSSGEPAARQAFRTDPVPMTGGRARFGHKRTWPKMKGSVAATAMLIYDDDSGMVGMSARMRRLEKALAVPAWDDWGRDAGTRSWKAHRRSQWKAEAGGLRCPCSLPIGEGKSLVDDREK
jgi:hypothetical protein